MRPKLRHALALIAEEGRTQREAALRAGLNEKSLSRAIQRPEIGAYLETLKAQAVMDAGALKQQARAAAIRVGLELMHEAKSEQVKARLVEFFAGEVKTGASVNVQVNVDRGGYEFVRPGARMVDIEPATDDASGADDGQEPDNT